MAGTRFSLQAHSGPTGIRSSGFSMLRARCEPSAFPALAFRPGLPAGFLADLFQGHVHAALPHDGPPLRGKPAAVLVMAREVLVATSDDAERLHVVKGAFDRCPGTMRLGRQGLDGRPCRPAIRLAPVGQGDQNQTSRGVRARGLTQRPRRTLPAHCFRPSPSPRHNSHRSDRQGAQTASTDNDAAVIHPIRMPHT